MGQDAIWHYYQTEQSEIFDENTGRLTFLAKKVSAGEKVLDIGVGNGAFERAALARGADLYCLDPSEQSVAKLREELSLGEKAKSGYSQAIPFESGIFDVVVMSEVLEHLADEVLEGTLQEVARVLKPHGRFIGTVPARENLAANLVACPHCSEKFHRWGHVRSFTPDSMRELLSSLFSVEQTRERKFITWKKRRGLAKVAALLKVSASGLGITVPDQSIFFAARKRG